MTPHTTVPSSEYELRIDRFVKEHLQKSCPLHITPGRLDAVAHVTYEKARLTLQKLFSAPLGVTLDEVKETVEGIIETICCDGMTLQSIAKIMYHDYYTHTHSINVCIYAVLFAQFRRFDPLMVRRLGEAAILHDIGKAAVDHRIINKAGKLSDTEFVQIRIHPHKSYEAALHFGVKDPLVLRGIRHHHEKLDGTGYPEGLRGGEIPEIARIIAVCDIFDALTTRRSYKEALSSHDAFFLIKERMHNHIDPEMLNGFIRMWGNEKGEPL